MTGYIGALTMILLVSMVLTRVVWLHKRGISAMKFGAIDKTDFLIPPFALLYLYLIFANAFGWPSFAHARLLDAAWSQWLGVVLCAFGANPDGAELDFLWDQLPRWN